MMAAEGSDTRSELIEHLLQPAKLRRDSPLGAKHSSRAHQAGVENTSHRSDSLPRPRFLQLYSASRYACAGHAASSCILVSFVDFRRAHLHLNCVSKAQAESGPGSSPLPVVANGIDLDRYTHASDRGEYCLVLARICPEKGIDIGLKAAHRFDFPMVVAGPVHPFRYHQAYFAECVQPLLDDKRR